jgi:hypothetical protein
VANKSGFGGKILNLQLAYLQPATIRLELPEIHIEPKIILY